MISLARAFVLYIVICIVLFAHTNGQKYSNKYDEINIDEILANPRLRTPYVRCLLNMAPCITGPSRFLKEKFAEAFVTKCKFCTEKQVEFFNKITDWFTTNEPHTWNRVVQLAIEEVQGKNSTTISVNKEHKINV